MHTARAALGNNREKTPRERSNREDVTVNELFDGIPTLLSDVIKGEKQVDLARAHMHAQTATQTHTQGRTHRHTHTPTHADLRQGQPAGLEALGGRHVGRPLGVNQRSVWTSFK